MMVVYLQASLLRGRSSLRWQKRECATCTQPTSTWRTILLILLIINIINTIVLLALIACRKKDGGLKRMATKPKAERRWRKNISISSLLDWCRALPLPPRQPAPQTEVRIREFVVACQKARRCLVVRIVVIACLPPCNGKQKCTVALIKYYFSTLVDRQNTYYVICKWNGAVITDRSITV